MNRRLIATLFVLLCWVNVGAIFVLQDLVVRIVRDDAGGLVQIGGREYDISWEMLATLLLVLAAFLADIIAILIRKFAGRRFTFTLIAATVPLNTLAAILVFGWVALIMVGM